MREGVTNKGGRLSRWEKGSQKRAGGGVIALKKDTDKHINEHLNAQQRGHREGGGGVIVCCAKGSQTRAGGYRAARRGHNQGRGVIALKKETDKHINEHLNAQERGHRQEVGVRAKCERETTKNERAPEKRASAKREKQKRTNEKRASAK